MTQALVILSSQRATNARVTCRSNMGGQGSCTETRMDIIYAAAFVKWGGTDIFKSCKASMTTCIDWIYCLHQDDANCLSAYQKEGQRKRLTYEIGINYFSIRIPLVRGVSTNVMQPHLFQYRGLCSRSIDEQSNRGQYSEFERGKKVIWIPFQILPFLVAITWLP